MNALKVTEAFCYICRGVLIEPVTLPCLHVFCYTCFEQSMQETSHSCPLCRKRISNWIRTVKKTNKLVDTILWDKIKEQYKEQVRLKLNGEDDGLDQCIQKEYEVLMPISKSGEVAEEFTKLLNDFKNEREKMKLAEEMASKELIEKLKFEEEQRLQDIRQQNLLRLKEDEKLALKMEKEQNNKISIKNNNTNEGEDVLKKSKKAVGPMDEFLKGLASLSKRPCYRKQILNQTEEDGNRNTSPDSTDSLRMELNLFKPIKKALRTPPKKYPDGRIKEIRLRKVTPLKLSFSKCSSSCSSDINTGEVKNIQSVNSAFVDTNISGAGIEEEQECTSKRLKFTVENSNNNKILKDITLEENNDPNNSSVTQDDIIKKKCIAKIIQENTLFSSEVYDRKEGENGENDNFETQDYLNISPTIEDKLIEEQKRIEQIIIQEKKDRELAMKLNEEWELEVRKKPMTRSMLANTIKKNSTFRSPKRQKTITSVDALSARRRK